MKLIKWLFRVLNIVVITGLAISYFAPFIDPRIFWPVSFFGLSFPMWLALGIILMVVNLFMRSKFALYYLITLTIGLPLILRSVSLAKAEPTEDIDFKVASFNTFSFGHTNNNSLTLDTVLRELDVDIALLYEWRRNRSKVKKQPFKYEAVVKRGVNSGLQILSKFPIIHTQKITLNDPYSDAAFADVIVKDDTIRFYLLHLESNRLAPKDYHRLKDFELDSTYTKHAKGIMTRVKLGMKKRAGQVETIVNHMSESPYPIIIGMDLNDTPQSFAYQQLIKNKKDAFMEGGSGWEGTYVKPFPFLRIDYILYDDAFVCKHYTSTDRIFSDHKLIFAAFQFKK